MNLKLRSSNSWGLSVHSTSNTGWIGSLFSKGIHSIHYTAQNFRGLQQRALIFLYTLCLGFCWTRLGWFRCQAAVCDQISCMCLVFCLQKSVAQEGKLKCMNTFRALLSHISKHPIGQSSHVPQVQHQWSARIPSYGGPGEDVNICWRITQSTIVWFCLVNKRWEFHCQDFIVSLSPKIFLFVISICYEWDEMWQHLQCYLAKKTACSYDF